ncbi:MBL fold metallo-hydrolase [Mariniflexile gromovii]|uniref:MBL fold metallo-hydrolase n=1 Tax=Mariniflexile gromovii TaxID=362523 RepID=A0ABS4BWS6_9FLAO|nr:MBL fold metallo-hydrolase [Mariniflexile gromovii]MBP0905048.1 MBL fold metallo-hydrolase [Mariniflexile gromovii]
MTSIQLIRNATVMFNYAGKKFLIDPMLAKKDAYPGFPGLTGSNQKIPMVNLPVSTNNLLDIDAIIVTHLHPDHWDEEAVRILPKSKPVFCQNIQDAKTVMADGFTDVRVIDKNTNYNGVLLKKTQCQHGSDEAYNNSQIASILGQSSGLYFNNLGEKSVYFVGDTIWIDEVELNLLKFKPNIIVLNAGFAILEPFGPIIMGKEDVYKVHQLLPEAIIIVIHLETINLCTLSRIELHEYINDIGISDHVIIPEDGQTLKFI